MSLYEDIRNAIPEELFRHGQARIGLDVESIEECRQLLESGLGLDMLQRSFTALERAYVGDDPELFAGRWAAKEAVAKAIGTGFRGLNPSQVEVYRSGSGQPFVRAADTEGWPNGAHEWSWAVSITRAGDAAIALAVGTPVRA